MSDETAIGSAGAPDGPGHPGGSSGEQSPLQARAAFLKNRSWEFIVSLNRGACERGKAQHGFNHEAQETCRGEWENLRPQVLAFGETVGILRQFHRKAPFLFFNGNTFAEVGRQIAAVIFAELPTGRRREVLSAVAHYIAGVLDREPMEQIVNELSVAVELQPGDQVKTLRGSMTGAVVRLMADGRVVWRTDSGMELIALPESLLRLTGK